MATRKSMGKAEGPTAGMDSQPQPRAGAPFNGIKVFSATMVADRERLGDRVTEWITAHPELEIVEIVQTQSSDENFHCIALSVFYLARLAGR